MTKLKFFLKTIPLLAVAVSISAQADEEALKKAAAAGKAKFALCGACHGMDGKGMEPIPGTKMAPSFFDSKLLKLDAEVTTVILLKGIKKDDPAAYMGQIMMGLGASMSDEDLANIVTYVRSEFGKVKEVTTAEQVAGWKKKHTAVAPLSLSRAELEKMGKKEEAKGE